MSDVAVRASGDWAETVPRWLSSVVVSDGFDSSMFRGLWWITFRTQFLLNNNALLSVILSIFCVSVGSTVHW